MITRNTLLVVFCSFVFPICPLLYGQATGSFSGTVSDKTGSVVSGASVKATAQGTGISRESKTDDSGHYLMPLLSIGEYTIRVDSQGFGPVEQKDVRLQVDEHRELNFTLTPASVTSTVEVSATEVAVQTTNPSLGQVITSEQVADLPLNGRNFVQLATLTPGTTQETNPDSFFNGGPSSEVSARGTFSLSVGGSRAQSTDWLLDGNDNNELTAGGIAIVPSIDAIQEFKVLTYNYSAEYGTRAGPTVLVTTKSGSNALPRIAVRILPQHQARRAQLFRGDQRTIQPESVWGRAGRPHPEGQDFLLRRLPGQDAAARDTVRWSDSDAGDEER